MSEANMEKAPVEKPKEKQKRNRRLSGRAQRFQDLLLQGKAMTKRQWSGMLYGDEDHRGSINGLMSLLNSKGIPVVNVKENPSAFPPEEGIICLGDRDRETAEKYTNGHVPKSTQTMLENYLKNSCVIMLNQPTVVITVLPLLTDIMRITLNAQHELQQSTKYGQLPSGNPAPVGPAS
jgi:hypothetical protein